MEKCYFPHTVADLYIPLWESKFQILKAEITVSPPPPTNGENLKISAPLMHFAGSATAILVMSLAYISNGSTLV